MQRDFINSSKSVHLQPLYLLYDERMLLHQPVGWVEPVVFPEVIEECESDYPMENPERLSVIYDRLCDVEERLLSASSDEDCGIVVTVPADCCYASSPASSSSSDTNQQERKHQKRLFGPLRCRLATREEICMVHSEDKYDRLNELQHLSDEALEAYSDQQQDIYYNQDTFQAARLAAGGLLACVDAVCNVVETAAGTTSSSTKPCNKAVALVRPPGHHACQSKEMGFCFIDSVVVAAKYAIRKHKAKRVVILDWDIHDGNGTSELTINDENIFRIDIHRFNLREGFYPCTGASSDTGSGNAKGLNLNMAWSHGGMGNVEYAAAFHELILPLLADYQPDLLLISCGLDAALGDLLGDCELTPDFFHAMTRATLEVVGPHTPVICALEGGYNLNILPDSMEAVTLGMLNCPYRYHTNGNYFSGASMESPALAVPWTAANCLERSRRVLSKYYSTGSGGAGITSSSSFSASSVLMKSAIHDINNCIRIFKREPRWKKVTLCKLRRPPKLLLELQGGNQPTKKRNKQGTGDTTGSDDEVEDEGDRPFQRPRIYMWYGTERHHKAMKYHHQLAALGS